MVSQVRDSSLPRESFFPVIRRLWESTDLEHLQTAAKVAALTCASYLTEPICKVREYYYTLAILDHTCKTTTEKVVKRVLLPLGMIGFALLTPFTAPLGALARAAVIACESHPYIFIQKAEKGKNLPLDKTITLVSHNECYMPAGYSITDGQVTPPADKKRMDANIHMIKQLDPDIVCLYEVPDICDAEYISSKLPAYPFIIPVAGVRIIGPSSMMYVASKYEIEKDSIRFIPFEKGTELTGRARYSEKGFLSFEIKSQNTPIATVVSTHLQHSEIPSKPEDEEIKARSLQMGKIAKWIKTKLDEGLPVIFTGDLNQNETELQVFLIDNKIDWLRRDPCVQGQTTWGGDAICAVLEGKQASSSEVLDYTFVGGTACNISTKVIGTGYSGLAFRPEATSDHDLLFSTISLAQESQ